MLTSTHAHFHWLKFIKNIFKKLQHVSVYDHHQGVTMSLPKSLLFKPQLYAYLWQHIILFGSVCACGASRVCVVHSTSKNTHTRDAPQAQTDLNNMICCHTTTLNRLTPNDPYMGRTAPLTSKRCILHIYSTNTGTEYFKHGLYSPFLSLQNAVCFIMLTCLVPVLFTFYIQSVLKLKK